MDVFIFSHEHFRKGRENLMNPIFVIIILNGLLSIPFQFHLYYSIPNLGSLHVEPLWRRTKHWLPTVVFPRRLRAVVWVKFVSTRTQKCLSLLVWKVKNKPINKLRGLIFYDYYYSWVLINIKYLAYGLRPQWIICERFNGETRQLPLPVLTGGGTFPKVTST